MTNGLKRNFAILISRLDKGTGVVIFNPTDYITKMATILDDNAKFLNLVDLSLDDTDKLEVKLQKRFLDLSKKKLLPKNVMIFCVP